MKRERVMRMGRRKRLSFILAACALFCSTWASASYAGSRSDLQVLFDKIPTTFLVTAYAAETADAHRESGESPSILQNSVYVVIFAGLLLGWIAVFMQNRRLKNAARKLRNERSFYHSIINNQAEIICRFKPDFTITFANEACCSLLKTKEHDLIGSSLLDRVAEEDCSLAQKKVSELTPSKPRTSFDLLLSPAGESLYWHHWTVQAIFGEDKSILEYQTTCRDVTDLKRIHEALLQTKNEAEEANRAKSDFLARMSHELRTPLNSVIGFASILLKNKENKFCDRDLNFLKRILSNGKHLLELINQILDLSKIESGRMDVQVERVYLNRLIMDVLDQLEDQIHLRKISICTDFPDWMAPIITDAGKIKQILINLIGNAIKFTQEGGVTLHVDIDEATRLPIHLDVIDTGIGISEDRLSTIFEPFQQVDSGHGRLYEGTGLGLTISKSLCELLGFQLEVESCPSEGSRFRIVMNAHLNPEHHGATELVDHSKMAVWGDRIKTERSLLAGKTVLIIDDEKDARFLLQHTVEEFGCNALIASSGQEGLEQAAAHHPDAILMDVMMPEMNGWEVLIQLKSDPDLCHIPVIIVSIVASDLKGVSLGLVDLLDKPVNPDQLYNTLLENLHRSQIFALLVEKNEKERIRIASILEKEHFEVLRAADAEEALRLLKSRKLDAILIDFSTDRSSALQMLDSLQDNERREHSLIIGIFPEEEPAASIEEAGRLSCIVHKGRKFEQDLRKALDNILK
ncbi:MAG: response regulator [Candidatus Omnitrophica bacterium]|nr:response regulator [Candidatus Omnitrophota bacterium]